MTGFASAPAAPAASPGPLTAGARIAEIDLLRGLVIVLMALDHVRDYFLAGGMMVNPLDPEQTTPWLYATRWITHICAPTFVLLSGVSAYLQLAKGKTRDQLSMFLLTRGIWLILLEASVISFAWSFSFPPFLFLQVIWAIGWSMLALAGLIWLPRMAVLAVGVLIVAGHNLLDPVSADELGGALGLAWRFLHDGGLIFIAPGAPIGLLAYPVLAWIGVIAVGYGMGSLMLEPPARRARTLVMLGLAMAVAFLLLRGFELYGEPAIGLAGSPFGPAESWREQSTLGAAIMVFLNVQKYPPSLQFLLATLGLVFLIWPLLARLGGPVAAILKTFGATPFFFYVLHLYLIHALAMLANAALGREVSGFFNYMVNGFVAPDRLAHLGFGLPWVYVAWVVALALLYPLCRYWRDLKQRRRDWWLSYL